MTSRTIGNSFVIRHSDFVIPPSPFPLLSVTMHRWRQNPAEPAVEETIDAERAGAGRVFGVAGARFGPLVPGPPGQGRSVLHLHHGAVRLRRVPQQQQGKVSRRQRYDRLWSGGVLLVAAGRPSAGLLVPGRRRLAGLARLGPGQPDEQPPQGVVGRVHGPAAVVRSAPSRTTPTPINRSSATCTANCTAISSWPDSSR